MTVFGLSQSCSSSSLYPLWSGNRSNTGSVSSVNNYVCIKLEPCPALAMKSRVSSLLTSLDTLLRGVEVWNSLSDKVSILSPSPPPPPSHEPLVILYLVPHFAEVWKCGIVQQSEDIVALCPPSWTPCHSLLSSTLLRGVEVWNGLTK